jgi:hypothetical protein
MKCHGSERKKSLESQTSSEAFLQIIITGTFELTKDTEFTGRRQNHSLTYGELA